MKADAFKIYAVRNREGKYFRAKGYGGRGESWVDGVSMARLYVRLSPARGTVSWFAAQCPEYGIPEIVVFTASETGVLDESERVSAKVERKLAKARAQEEYRLSEERKEDERQLERLRRKLAGV